MRMIVIMLAFFVKVSLMLRLSMVLAFEDAGYFTLFLRVGCFLLSW